MRYYYANKNNEVVGPLDQEAILELVKLGIVENMTNLHLEGGNEWLPYKDTMLFQNKSNLILKTEKPWSYIAETSYNLFTRKLNDFSKEQVASAECAPGEKDKQVIASLTGSVFNLINLEFSPSDLAKSNYQKNPQLVSEEDFALLISALHAAFLEYARQKYPLINNSTENLSEFFKEFLSAQFDDEKYYIGGIASRIEELDAFLRVFFENCFGQRQVTPNPLKDFGISKPFGRYDIAYNFSLVFESMALEDLMKVFASRG